MQGLQFLVDPAASRPLSGTFNSVHPETGESVLSGKISGSNRVLFEIEKRTDEAGKGCLVV
jgi:hypothetical protein